MVSIRSRILLAGRIEECCNEYFGLIRKMSGRTGTMGILCAYHPIIMSRHSTYETNSKVVSLTRVLENHPIPTFVPLFGIVPARIQK